MSRTDLSISLGASARAITRSAEAFPLLGSRFVCDSVSSLMYRWANSPCRKVLCRSCGTGCDDQTCPACGNHASEGAGPVQAFVDALPQIP